ncbi:MAG: FadR family transcriptional regulator [Chloroflexi bacterium]|nr:MAG: FadR family transcriptional regulator [Chloroflexota bacterium]
MNASLRPLVAEPGPADAAGWIRQLVVSGQFARGQRLPPERELATQFQVSRSSVREAIRELVALNILVTRRGAGTFVTDLSAAELFAPLHFALRVDPTSLLHLFELRRVLEPVAAAVAATRLDDEAVADLEALVASVKRRFMSGVEDLEGLVQVDERLHDEIIDTMHNPLISAIIRSLREAAHQSREFTVFIPSVPEQTLDELESIVAALAAHDPLRAEATMLRHLSRLEDTARKAMGVRGG